MLLVWLLLSFWLGCHYMFGLVSVIRFGFVTFTRFGLVAVICLVRLRLYVRFGYGCILFGCCYLSVVWVAVILFWLWSRLRVWIWLHIYIYMFSLFTFICDVWSRLRFVLGTIVFAVSVAFPFLVCLRFWCLASVTVLAFVWSRLYVGFGRGCCLALFVVLVLVWLRLHVGFGCGYSLVFTAVLVSVWLLI